MDELKLAKLLQLRQLQQLKAEQDRRHWYASRQWTTPGQMAKALDSTTVQTPALDLIDSALVRLASGEIDRLLLSMPPQEGKSERASRRFPLYLLSEEPNTRVAVVSYSDEMARRWGSEIKRDLEDNPQLGVQLRSDSKAAGRWQIDGKRGGVYCVGIAGSLTGKPVDCVRGDTKILTQYGYARIDDIHRNGAPYPRVLGYDHRTGRAGWRDIIASRAVADRPLVEVVTTSGRRIVCTPDHRIFTTDRGYVPADQLRPGQGLVAADPGAGEVQRMSGGVLQGAVSAVARHSRDSAVLLEGVPVRGGVVGSDMRGLRVAVPQTARRGGQGCQAGPDEDVLHPGLLDVVDGLPDSGSPHRTDRAAASGFDGRDGRSGPDRDGPAPLLLPRRGCAVGRREPAPGMRSMRQGPQGQGSSLPGLLDAGTRRHVPDVALRTMRQRVHQDARGTREGATPRPKELLLLPQVRIGGTDELGLSLLEVWSADRVEGPRPTVLLQGMPAGGQQGRQGNTLPAMRSGVLPQVQADGVLRPNLRERCTLAADDRRGELALQGWDELRGLVPQNAPSDLRKGRAHLPGLRNGRPDGADRAGRCVPVQVSAAGAPHQRATMGQPARESDPAVRVLPHHTPQVEADAVSVVRELRGTRDVVYDLQVDGTSNFFADEVLVHNCLIIDDPIKDLEQAQSVVYRERFQRFWQGVAVPRLGPGARALVISTRWHEEDAAGWLLANEGRREDGGRWTVINIPAQCEDEKTDPLGRRHGEYMLSARGDRDWESIKKSVGSYVWSALYMGRPAPAEGGLFKRIWWRYHSLVGDRLHLGGRDYDLRDCWRFATVDLAASTRTSADYTVIAAWARTISGDLVLLDVVRARIGEEDHFARARPLVQRWHLDTVFVEASQYGTTLVREATNDGVPITPIQAEQDKFSRALPYSAWVSAGRVWLPGGNPHWLDAWLSEHASFPAAAHDDVVDVGSLAVRVAVTKWQPPPVGPRRAETLPRDLVSAVGSGSGVDPLSAI